MMNEFNLADISTQWSNVLRARQGDDASAARNELLLRYHEVVLRYLCVELRNEHAAGEVYSNFAVRVLEVNRFLRGVDPRRGRFRDYLKVILRHMVADYHRERQRENKRREDLNRGDNEPADQGSAQEDADQAFLKCWRQELLNRAFKALEEIETRTGQPYAVLLQLQAQQPDLHSPQMAERLTAQLQRPFTAVGVRQLILRGRELLGDLLVAEVARSLQVAPGDPAFPMRVEEELIDLGLLFSYCKRALARCRSAQ